MRKFFLIVGMISLGTGAAFEIIDPSGPMVFDHRVARVLGLGIGFFLIAGIPVLIVGLLHKASRDQSIGVLYFVWLMGFAVLTYSQVLAIQREGIISSKITTETPDNGSAPFIENITNPEP